MPRTALLALVLAVLTRTGCGFAPTSKVGAALLRVQVPCWRCDSKAVVLSTTDLPQQPPPQGSPPRPPRGGLALSAGGLLATLVLASSALSMTGTIATIAASFAGVFSFKLAKDLSSCGVSKFTVQQIVARTVASTAQLGIRAGVSLGVAAAYAVASLVSLVVWVLTRVGESVLQVAELTNRLKPSPEAAPPYSQLEDTPTITDTSLGRASQRRGASHLDRSTPYGNANRQLDHADGTVPDVPTTKAARHVGAQSRVSKASDLSQTSLMPTDAREIGRALAVEQMLKRSSQAAAAARRVEAEKSAMLQGRQAEAVRKVFNDRRSAISDETAPAMPERTAESAGMDLRQGSTSPTGSTRPAPRPSEVPGRARQNPSKMDQSMAEKMRERGSSTALPTSMTASSFNPYLPRGAKPLGKPDGSKSSGAETNPRTEAPQSSAKFNPFLPRGVNFDSK